jgi:hypothetical protein
MTAAGASPVRAYAVIDIDGVLADVRHRLRHIGKQPLDWDAFFAAAVDDPLLDEGLAVAQRLAADHEVVYLSGRPERCRGDTLDWLRDNALPPGRLMLRRSGDRRPASVIKPEVLRELARHAPVSMLVDDDPLVCAAAEAAGFAVFRASWMAEQPELRRAQEIDGAT